VGLGAKRVRTVMRMEDPDRVWRSALTGVLGCS